MHHTPKENILAAGLGLFKDRCPGKLITVQNFKTLLTYLTRDVTYRVPRQDLSYNLARMPALPHSGFIIEQVRTR